MIQIVSNASYDSDLAVERLRTNEELAGVARTQYTAASLPVTRLEIQTDDAAEKTGNPKGIYYTVAYPYTFEGVIGTAKEAVLTHILTSLLPPLHDGPLLVIGIGNASITADAVGVRAAEGVIAMPHSLSGVCVLSPGTEEMTGIPLLSLIRACTKLMHPRAIVALDAITTRSSERLLSTIQITNTGILPGSGIRSGRAILNYDTVGVPVIAIGLPTVISVNALLRECTGTAASSALPFTHLSPHDLSLGVERGAAVIAGGINQLTNLF